MEEDLQPQPWVKFFYGHHSWNVTHSRKDANGPRYGSAQCTFEL